MEGVLGLDESARSIGIGGRGTRERAGGRKPANHDRKLCRLSGLLARPPGLALADARALELAAGGHDVAPAGRADRARIAGVEDDVAERGDGGIAAALEWR